MSFNDAIYESRTPPNTPRGPAPQGGTSTTQTPYAVRPAFMRRMKADPELMRKYHSIYRNWLESIGGIDTNPQVFNSYLMNSPMNFFKFAEKFNEQLQVSPGATTTQIVREITSDQMKNEERILFKEFTDASGTTLDATLAPSDPTPGSFVLRARYEMANGTDVEEALTTQVKDTVQGDLFNFVQPNAEEGYKNSLFLDNRLNDALRYAGSDVKPFEKFPNGLGFDSSLFSQQFESASEGLQEITTDAVVVAPLQSKELSGFGVLPGSNIISKEPYTQTIKSSYMIPADIPPGNFGRDNFSQPLAAQFNNMVGFKPYYDQYRYPFNPSFQQTAHMDPRSQIAQAITVGPQMY